MDQTTLESSQPLPNTVHHPTFFNEFTNFELVRGPQLKEEVQLQARAPRRQAGARRGEEERQGAAQGPRGQPRLRQTQEDDTLREQGG